MTGQHRLSRARSESGTRVSVSEWMVFGVVLAVTLATFWPVVDNGFIALDDPDYVTKNPDVQGGLRPAGVVWALTTSHADNWHPLTWISHMVDWSLFGPVAWGHHLTSLLLHAANAGLLFLALRRLTGATNRSALVALLFGVHPLHVESVAWVAERKDVLSTLFWMLAMLAYPGRGRAPTAWSGMLVAICLLLGLLAKPMLVTIPLILLLLDLWPLRRWPASSEGGPAAVGLLRIVAEKLPLFVIAGGSVIVTFWAQSLGGAVASFERYTLGTRIRNAAVSYVAYLGETFWPAGLAPYYPHPGDSLRLGSAIAAAATLAAVTWAAFALRRRAPYLLTGWLWYVVTLLPVIGLVQVGWQARADRYTYIPLIGVFIAVVWGLGDLGARIGNRARPGGWVRSEWALLPVAVAIPVLAILSRIQIGYWKDSETLFERTLAVTENNFTIHWALGNALAERSNRDAAILHYREALRIMPRFPEVHHNLATLLWLSGRLEEAAAHYREAIALWPGASRSHRDLGRLLVMTGHLDEALSHFEVWVRLEPDSAEARAEMNAVRFRLGRR